MAAAEHPLVTAHTLYTAADLVGQRLKCLALISHTQRARHRRAGRFAKKYFDGLFKVPVQQMLYASAWNQRLGWHTGLDGQVEAMDSVEKEQRSHPHVEVVVAMAQYFQFGRFLK